MNERFPTYITVSSVFCHHAMSRDEAIDKITDSIVRGLKIQHTDAGKTWEESKDEYDIEKSDQVLLEERLAVGDAKSCIQALSTIQNLVHHKNRHSLLTDNEWTMIYTNATDCIEFIKFTNDCPKFL
jgi:hypothetical protein